MEVGDVQFRIGLIIAVMVLGSAFAGGLYLLMGENDGGEAKRTADTIGRALEALSPGSTESSLQIEFRSGQAEGIRVDPYLGGEHYTIHVLPSMIYIDWKDGREIVSELKGIIPSYKPYSDEGDPIPILGLIDCCDGYAIDTPCTLFVDHFEFNGSGYLMVHPATGDWTANASDFASFLLDDSLPQAGSEFRRDLEPGGPSRIEGRWLLVTKEKGSCPFPIWIPNSFTIMLPNQFQDVTAIIRTTSTDEGVSISRSLR